MIYKALTISRLTRLSATKSMWLPTYRERAKQSSKWASTSCSRTKSCRERYYQKILIHDRGMTSNSWYIKGSNSSVIAFSPRANLLQILPLNYTKYRCTLLDLNNHLFHVKFRIISGNLFKVIDMSMGCNRMKLEL